MKVGIIGCGKQAPKHISGLKSAGISEIVVADIQLDAATRLARSDSGLTAATDIDAIFADPEIKAISICTPTPSHAPLIRKAIKAGKHYMCEKPLCENIDEAHELARMTQEKGLVGMVGYVYRFVPSFDVAHQILGDARTTGISPILGRVTNAFLRIGGRGSHAAWKHDRASGGGAINEMMVHMVDLSNWFFGNPSEAQLMQSKQRWPTRVINGKEIAVDAEDMTLAQLSYPSGIEVLIQADFITPAFTQYLEIQGENGSLFGSIQSDMPSFVFCVDPRGSYYAGRTELPSQQVNLFEAQMGEFVNAIRNNTTPRRGDIADTLNVMETVERLRAQL